MRRPSLVVERALRGEATPDELLRLTAWRAAGAEHEECARDTARVLRLVWRLRPRGDVHPPSAANIIARAQRATTL